MGKRGQSGADRFGADETDRAWDPNRAWERLEIQGEIMLGKIDDKSTASWLRRALADEARLSGEHADVGAVVKAHAGRTRDGWDPWEVWLRKIEQPRRMRRRDDSLK